MKFIFFALSFSTILLYSCSKEKNIFSDADLLQNDNDVDIENDDYDRITPACLNEWEKTEIVEDVSEFFKFEIVKEVEKWSWVFEKNSDVFLISDGVNTEVKDLIVEEKGNVFVLIDDFEKNRENFLNIYKSNGDVEKHYFKSDISFEMITPSGTPVVRRSQAQKMIYDDLSGDLYVLFVLPDKDPDYLDKELKFKSVIGKIDKEGVWAFKVLNFTGNTICSDFFKEGERFFFNCQYYFGVNGFSSSGMNNQAVIISDNKTAFRQTFFSDQNAITTNLSVFNNKMEFYTFNGPVGMSPDALIDSSFLILDQKSFCSERIEFKEILNRKGLFPLFCGSTVENRILYGQTLEYFERVVDGITSSWNGARGLIVISDEKKDAVKIIKLGSEESPLETKIFRIFNVTDLIEFNGHIFFTGSSTFDMEDKNREWCEANSEQYLCYDSVLGAIDREGNVFLRQLVSSLQGDIAQRIFADENNIFIGGSYVLDEKEIVLRNGFVSRIDKSWLLSEEAKAKSSRIWIENISNDKTQTNESKYISSGGFHSCVVNVEDNLMCWGDNSKKQLGLYAEEESENITSSNPVDVEIGSVLNANKIKQISSGYQHACAVDDAGISYCWGAAMSGQIGDGTKDSYVENIRKVDMNGVLKGSKLIDISSGRSHTCSFDSNGNVYCWGGNLSGQLGAGITDTEKLYPVKTIFSDKRKILEISSGSKHTCVIDELGDVFCWGANEKGQLGDGNGGFAGDDKTPADFSRIPVKAESGELKFSDVSAGYSHTCILSDAGKIYCFGDNKNGQLGDGTTEMRLTPVALNSDKVFKSVSAGFEHTCAIDDKDELYCWGGNPVGQLGTGDKENSLTPVKVKYDTETKIRSISCGHRHTCSVTTEGIVHCWGWNTSGQLGNGTYEDSLTPKEIKAKE